MLVTTDRYFYL